MERYNQLTKTDENFIRTGNGIIADFLGLEKGKEDDYYWKFNQAKMRPLFDNYDFPEWCSTEDEHYLLHAGAMLFHCDYNWLIYAMDEAHKKLLPRHAMQTGLSISHLTPIKPIMESYRELVKAIQLNNF